MKHRQKRYLQRSSAGKRMIRPWSMVTVCVEQNEVFALVGGARVAKMRISNSVDGSKQLCVDVFGNVYCGDIDYRRASGQWSLKSILA